MRWYSGNSSATVYQRKSLFEQEVIGKYKSFIYPKLLAFISQELELKSFISIYKRIIWDLADGMYKSGKKLLTQCCWNNVCSSKTNAIYK